MSALSYSRNHLIRAYRTIRPFVQELRPIGVISIALQVIAVVGIVVSLWMARISVPIITLHSAVITVLVVHLLQRYCDRLDRRSFMDQKRPDWAVTANGIDMGMIRDSDYASIRRQVYGNGVIHARQLFATLAALVRVFDSMFLSIPVLSFWFVVGTAVFAPGTFQSSVEQMGHYSLHDVLSLLPHIGPIVLVLGLFGALARLMAGYTYGWANVFEAEINDIVRQRVGSSATGNIEIWRMDGMRKVIASDDYRIGGAV